MNQNATAKGTEADCVSRSFCPKLSVAEDPVCGSAHCQIADYWSGELNKKQITAYQASKRGGYLYCELREDGRICFTDYQEQYLADPKSGPCPFFNVGDEFILKRTPQQDDFYHLMNGKFCGEAWDAISRYVYTALQGGSIMKGWTNDDRMMIACCNDGTRPVIFKIERIDIPENDEEREWLAKQNFRNTVEDAYTG